MTKTLEEQVSIIGKVLGTNTTGSGYKPSNKGPNESNHVWSIHDENIAFDLYKTKATDAEIKAIMEKNNLGMPFNGMKMKLGNIKALHTGDGLHNYSTLTEFVYTTRMNELL